MNSTGERSKSQDARLHQVVGSDILRCNIQPKGTGVGRRRLGQLASVWMVHLQALAPLIAVIGSACKATQCLRPRGYVHPAAVPHL